MRPFPRTTPPALTLALVLAAAPAAAQLPADTLAGRTAPRPRSMLVAAVAEYLVPTLGHAYAGDWERGLAPAAVFAAGGGMAALGVASCVDEDGCGVLLAGVAVAVAGKLWGMASAVDAVRDRVRAVRACPVASLRPGALAVGVSLTRSRGPGR